MVAVMVDGCSDGYSDGCSDGRIGDAGELLVLQLHHCWLYFRRINKIMPPNTPLNKYNG